MNELSESEITLADSADSDRPSAALELRTDGSLLVRRRAARSYILLPLIFLAVTLLGGLRFASVDASFIFVKPPLTALLFAAALIILFLRARLIDFGGWFGEQYSVLHNTANAGVLLTIFAASSQLFNSLLPESGLPFWVVGFCFFWTFWNNLFDDLDTRKLFRSLAAMFALAFLVKYVLLANLTAPGDATLLQRIFENPAKEAATWLLDLPRYSAATGYLQFSVLALYLIGLFLTPRDARENAKVDVLSA